MRIRYAGRMWDVMLEDDGTLDTVVSVSPDTRKQDFDTAEKLVQTHVDAGLDIAYARACGGRCPSCGLSVEQCFKRICRDYFHPWQEIRFAGEHAAEYRRPNGEMTMRGLRILGQEAAEAYDAVELAE